MSNAVVAVTYFGNFAVVFFIVDQSTVLRFSRISSIWNPKFIKKTMLMLFFFSHKFTSAQENVFYPTQCFFPWLNKNQFLKCLLQLTNINASNLLSVKRHQSDLNFRPAMLKRRVLAL